MLSADERRAIDNDIFDPADTTITPDEPCPYDALNEAVRLARYGLSVSPWVLTGRDKKPAFEGSWLHNATCNISDVVQDFEHAVSKYGNDRVLVGWAVGKDGYFAIDDDYGLPDPVAKVLDHPHAANVTFRGRHLIFRNPDGLVPGNSTDRFPDTGFGEGRGRGGCIIVAGADRPGFDPTQLEHAGPFPFPEWLTPADEGAAPADNATVAAFMAEHADKIDTDRLEHFIGKLKVDPKASRHERLIKYAGMLMRDARAGIIAADDARSALSEWWSASRLDTDNARTWSNDLDRYIACAIGYANAEPQTAIDERLRKAEAFRPLTTLVADTQAAAPPPCTLDHAHTVFRRYLGAEYDIDALDVTLATAAAERLAGDPLWLLLVSGSGNAKTETVQSLRGAGAHVASTISSDGALLSGTPNKQKAKDATGGLLRKIGDRGLLVIKDVTSILSMDRNTRGAVLAAFREIHDGQWVRYLGTDGGKTLEWSGRIVIVGAVTTAWDRAHDVIASMGDRFLIVRMDSTAGRTAAGQQSRRNVGHEEQMRSELSDAVAGVLAGANLDDDIDVTDDEADALLAAADLVTLARTGVDYDYRGDVIDAHAPEMPTRFMKQLVQLVRGSVAIGMERSDAVRLAIRCARDSMPPLRLAILDDIAKHPASTSTEVRRRLDKPRATADRQLQALHILGVLRLDEDEATRGDGKATTTWRYSLADGIDPSTLKPLPDLLPHTHKGTEKRGAEIEEQDAVTVGSHISGNGPDPVQEPF